MSSVDPLEAAKFEAYAQMWWDAQGRMWPLHTLNTLRVQILREALAPLLGRSAEASWEGLSVLDIGCGGGILSESIARLGAHVVGVDVVARNLEIARQHAVVSGLEIDYRHSSAEALAASGEQFDVVLNMEVVEHVADLTGFMQACNAVLRPGGATAVATINRTVLARVTALWAAEYLLRLLPRGTHQYQRLVKPSELTALLQAGGCEVVTQCGVGVDPFRRRMWRRSSLAVNYMLLAKKSEGVTMPVTH